MTGEPGHTLEGFTASDGYRWLYRRYRPHGKPRGRVVCVHGIQSHSGWYDASCHRLAAEGFAVSFLDRRGAGLNQEARGDTPGFRRLLDDVAEFLRAPDPGTTGLPTFLLAISWGGKPAVAMQMRHPGLVDGLALLCPGFCPRVGPSRRQRLAMLWSRLVGPRRFFAVPLSDPELFTANPQRQEFIRADPLALREATARFFVESVRLDLYLRWARRNVRIPVLLMLAGRDRIIDNIRTRRFVDYFPSPDREVVEYPCGHHTLEFEPDPGPFLADLCGWLNRKAHKYNRAGEVRRET
jgi:alpha-beta hydrolase superfamily lysophospholipase